MFVMSFSIYSQTIKLAVPGGFEPMSYIEDGHAAGFFTDLAVDILKKYGYKVEIHTGTWNECLEGIESGEYDLLGFIQYTPERDEVLDYTHLYVITSWTQVVENKNSKYDTPMSLNKKTIGVVKNDNNAVAFRKYMSSFNVYYYEIVFNTYEEIEEAIADGKIDAAPMMGMYRTKNPQVKTSSIILNPNQLYYVTKEGQNKHILSLIDQELSRQKDDEFSDYNKLLRKYVNQQIEINIFPKWFWILLSAIVVMSCMIFAMRKIIISKTKELKNAKDDLEIRVEQKTAELRQTYEQLYQNEKMASLGNLVSGIAHEINTPLGAIMAAVGGIMDIKEFNNILGFLRDLDDKDYKVVSNVYKKFIENQLSVDIHNQRLIKQNIKNDLLNRNITISNTVLNMLVDLGIKEVDDDIIYMLKSPYASKIENIGSVASVFQMMDLIKQSSEKISKIVSALRIYSHQDETEEKVKLNIYEQIESLLVLYYNKMKYNIEIERNYDTTIPEVYGYPDKLSQVFVNILNNALQAMNYKGKITIEVETEKDELRISIIDTGPGIPVEVQDKIFTPFFTTKKTGEGSGLGLSISKTIVEAHGGRIDFNTSSVGTRFSIYLPIGDKQHG